MPSTPRKRKRGDQQQTVHHLSEPEDDGRARPDPVPKSAYRQLVEAVAAGDTEALLPARQGQSGINYKSLAKPSEPDERLPDLIRIIIVHRGKGDDPLEVSLKLRFLPLLDARGQAKEIIMDGIPLQMRSTTQDSYIALSYAWGEQVPDEKIVIRHGANVTKDLITLNLMLALKALRQDGSDIQLWADQICIDQKQSAEKNQQLPLMPRIYSGADSVCVWLGPGIYSDNYDPDDPQRPDITKEAFQLMRKIRIYENLPKIVESQTPPSQWLTLIKLLDLQWFKRRWVVQEIVLASQAELRCGDQKIDWMEFAQAMAIFESMEDTLNAVFQKNDALNNPHGMFKQVSELSALKLVKATTDVVRREDDGRVDSKTESLEMLISSLTQFNTGDPKDIIYAILSLAKDVKATAAHVQLKSKIDHELLNKYFDEKKYEVEKRVEVTRILTRIALNWRYDRFPVDYAKSFDEICDDLYRFVTRHSNSLDMICRPWCPGTAETPKMEGVILPSWIRPVEDQAFVSRNGSVKRINPDSLVGLPGRSPYSAAGNLRGKWDFERDGTGEHESKKKQILSVLGFQVDILDAIEDPATGGTIPKSWMKYKRPQGLPTTGRQASTKKVSDQFWRTMVAGKGGNGENAPSSYYLLAEKIFEQDEHVNLEAIRHSKNILHANFVERVLAVVFNRKLARTTKSKRLALLPPTTKSGDIVCILYGCSVPVVLRKTGEVTKTLTETSATLGSELNERDKHRGGEEIWELIGECYVYGMMFGEALVSRREGLERAQSVEEKSFHADRTFRIG